LRIPVTDGGLDATIPSSHEGMMTIQVPQRLFQGTLDALILQSLAGEPRDPGPPRDRDVAGSRAAL